MPYLIDGHNLIGQLPDIDLADPNDEVKLILKLRSFAARQNKQITVVFDNGMPAGFDRRLSNGPVRVRFASSQSSADEILKQMIRANRNPSGWTFVSSDIEVTNIAKRSGMNVIRAEHFAKILQQTLKKASPIEEDPKRNPQLSEHEIEEWLTIFGDDEDDDFLLF